MFLWTENDSEVLFPPPLLRCREGRRVLPHQVFVVSECLLYMWAKYSPMELGWFAWKTSSRGSCIWKLDSQLVAAEGGNENIEGFSLWRKKQISRDGLGGFAAQPHFLHSLFPVCGWDVNSQLLLLLCLPHHYEHLAVWNHSPQTPLPYAFYHINSEVTNSCLYPYLVPNSYFWSMCILTPSNQHTSPTVIATDCGVSVQTVLCLLSQAFSVYPFYSLPLCTL